MRHVTFGITTFDRPKLLANLVRSILKRYPTARIVVANNGKRMPRLPDCVKVLQLEFDCGLSAARNAIVDQLQTPYLLILEDDFLFIPETHIEPMLEVLEADAEVGCVGGALRDVNGRVACYALDIEVFRDRMEVREATHRVRITPAGSPYRLCDMVWNFCLFRREMLQDHRWDDRLKVGEHCPYFHQVKLGAKWRVATTNATAIYHVPQKRPADYLQYRQRAQDLFDSYLATQGVRHYRRVMPFHYEDDAEDRPCVVVLGVGHSGTSVVTRMLHALGWNAGDADRQFAESVRVRRLNMGIEAHGRLNDQAAARTLRWLPSPWAIKDPRFCRTLHHWLEHFAQMERRPLLLRVRRDRDSLLASYQRRNAPGDYEQMVDQLSQLCQQQYDRWPWERMCIDYDRLGDAFGAFSASRFADQQARPFDRFAQYDRDTWRPATSRGALGASLVTLVAHARVNRRQYPAATLSALQVLYGEQTGRRPAPDVLAKAMWVMAEFAGRAELLGFPPDVQRALAVFGALKAGQGSPIGVVHGDGSGDPPGFDGLIGDGSGDPPGFDGLFGDGSGDPPSFDGLFGDGSGDPPGFDGLFGDGSGDPPGFDGLFGDGSGDPPGFDGLFGDGSGDPPDLPGME
ncbi:MAG: glycosyltransferase [Planctomycetales bacterium]|nr:glycosyltransferase [Planctomycetales bacterium]